MNTQMDYLVMEDCLLDKVAQPSTGAARWHREYEPD